MNKYHITGLPVFQALKLSCQISAQGGGLIILSNRLQVRKSTIPTSKPSILQERFMDVRLDLTALGFRT